MRFELVRNPVVRVAGMVGTYATTVLLCGGLSAYGLHSLVGSIAVKILPDEGPARTDRMSFPAAAALLLSADVPMDRMTFPVASALLPAYAPAEAAAGAATVSVDREALTLAALNSGESESAYAWSSGATETYRTMCVRLCDGSFFPISFATTREFFESDDAACQSRCASPARLYVFKNPGETPASMKNLDGEPYTKLATAYSFRVKYHASCTCNDQPWQQEARDRHRVYALREAEAGGAAREADRVELARLETALETRRRIETDAPEAEAADYMADLAEPRIDRPKKIRERVRTRIRTASLAPPRRSVPPGIMRVGARRGWSAPRARFSKLEFAVPRRGPTIGDIIRRSIGGF